MKKQIALGAILQYIQMFASIIVGLVYTPFMIKILGDSEYGLYNLSSSLISYLSLFSLGLGASYVRFYSIKLKDGPESVKKLNGLYLFSFTIIGLIVLGASFVVSSNVHLFLNDSYTIKDTNIAKVLMLLLGINLAISFPMSIFHSYVMAQEKFVFLKLLTLFKTVCSPALSIVFLFLGYGSIGMVVATTILNCLIDLVCMFYCFKKINMKISFKKMEFVMLKELLAFSGFIAINQLIDQINWNVDKVILGKMINSTAVAIYSVGATINTYFTQFSTAISGLYVRKINKIVVENKPDMDDKLTNLMTSVGRIQFMILMLIFTGFLIFGNKFIHYWVGPDYALSYYVALLLIFPAVVPLIQNIGIEIQRAKNKHKFRSIVYLIAALINVGISILMCSYFGVVGVTIGTTLSLIIANGFIMNFYYHFKLNINMRFFWKNILSLLPSVVIALLIGSVFIFCGTDSLFRLILQILTYIFIYLAIILSFGVDKKEKNIIYNYFKRLL